MNSRVLVIISVIVIGLGMYGIFLQGNKHSDKSKNAMAEQTVKKIKVYVAKQPIAKGTDIIRDNVEIRYLQGDQASKAGVDKDIHLDFEKHLFAKRDIVAGGFIFPENTVNPDSPDYLDFVVDPRHIPYPLEVNEATIIGGVIRLDSRIDILALAAENQNMAVKGQLGVTSFKNVSLTPVLSDIKVVKVSRIESKDEEHKAQKEPTRIILILELTPKQVATLTVAKKIAQLEVHKSTGYRESRAEMSANAGDVLDDYKAIKEFRADKETIN